MLTSNYIWYRIHKKEENKLTHALIPPFTEDYYMNAIALTNQAKQNGIWEYRNEENKTDIKWQVNVNRINQNPMYPNGCEAAAAVMLLNYYGIEISLEEFITEYLTKEDVYEYSGKRYGPNPATSYAGDPSSEKRGWGCFEPVIEQSIAKLLEKQSLKLHILTNQTKEPLNSLTNIRTPIMIWTTIDYQEVKEVYEWFSYDTKYTYTYPKNSHVILITGMDEFNYYINDSLKKETNIPIKKEILEKSFDSMGRQAILLSLLTQEQ